MRWSALRVPGGNQVDGLPPVSSFELRCLLTKMLKKWWNFRIFMKTRNKNCWIWKFTFEELPMKEISWVNYEWSDLLADLVHYQTIVLNWAASSPKCWKNDEIFEFSWKFRRKTPESGNLNLRSSPWRKFWERIINEVICSTSSRRKPGWRFTAGSTYGNSG